MQDPRQITKFAGAIAGVLSAAPSLVLAGSLFVATNGNDLNSGTIARPLRTIRAAAAKATAGTNVIVRGGIYSETAIHIDNSGTPKEFIRFSPDSGEVVVVDGGGTPPHGAVIDIKGSYVEFRGFEIRNATNGYGLLVQCTHHVNIIGNSVHDSFYNGIIIQCNDLGRSHDNAVIGNKVCNNSLYNIAAAAWTPGIGITRDSHSIIEENVVYQNMGEGIGTWLSQFITISKNTVYDNYSVEIYLDNAAYATVDSNFIFNTGDRRFLNKKGNQAVSIGAAIETYPGRPSLPLAGIEIRNNITVGGQYSFYYGNYGTGGGMQNSIVANNTFTNPQQETAHIDASAHSGNLYMNNINYADGRQRPLTSGDAIGWAFDYNNWYTGFATPGFTGAHDVIANPALIAPGARVAGGYRMAPNSPVAGDSAVPCLGISDFWKQTTAPCRIGAHQSGVADLDPAILSCGK
jgi:parallel beta-helix repeat protein